MKDLTHTLTRATVTAKTLAAGIADSEGLTRKQAERLLTGLLDDIGFSLAAGQEVQIHGFGTFKVQATAAREGNGPFGPWSKPAGRKIVFKPAKALKDLIDLN